MIHLVMIPAFGCDERLYAKIVPALNEVSAPLPIIADGDTYEDCVRQILDRVPETFVILGTSFGGRAAMEVVVAAPERVRGLIVIGSTAGPTADPAAGLSRSLRLRRGEMEEIIAEMGAIISHLPGPNGPSTRDAFITMARTQGAELMARQSDAMAKRSDLRPQLSSVACQALMLWGAHDQFASADDGRALSKTIPRAQYVEIADCGHFPPLEAPDETADAIRRWFIANRLI